MSALRFVPFSPGLDPADVVMIDGWAPGFRMISHWPGNSTPAALRHDLTTGAAFSFVDLSEREQHELVGGFSIVTNNHYDADGALSLFTMLHPKVALRHRDLMLRTARSGFFAAWSGADALALELSIMSDLEPFMPFSTPPYDAERLGNLSRAYERIFVRIESLLNDPFEGRAQWEKRHAQVLADVARIERREGIAVTRYPEDDLAVIETDRPITSFGMRVAAGDLFRVLLVHSGDRERARFRGSDGMRCYRFCFRNESWWDVVSMHPHPRKDLTQLAARLNASEDGPNQLWWASPPNWTVPEVGFGEPVTFRHRAARFDPRVDRDPASRLPLDVRVLESAASPAHRSARTTATLACDRR